MERFHDYRQHIRKPGMLTPWHKKQIVQNYVVKIWKKVHTKAGDIHVWLSLARLLIYNCCVVFMIYWDLTFLYHFSLYKGLFSGKITCLRTKGKFTDLDFLCAIIIYQTYLPQSFCYDFIVPDRVTCHMTKDAFAILHEIGLTNCCDAWANV